MPAKQSQLALTFILALVLALAASYLVYRQLSSAAPVEAQGQQVVIAAADLTIGTPLTADDLTVTRWPTSDLPAGTAMDKDALIGRPLIYPVFKGEPILTSKLALEGSGAGLSAVIDEGMRAVSIRVDEVVAVAGFVVAGTHVDIMLTGNPGSGEEQLTQTILEDVQVLAAGQSIQPDAEGKPQRVNVVTFLCTPDDAAKVILAASEGRIQLVLRNAVDKNDEEQLTKDLPKVGRRELYAGGAPPPRPAAARPAPPPPAPIAPPPPEPVSIMMIRGSQVSNVELETENLEQE
jgi:pilus assembly protein CpaB